MTNQAAWIKEKQARVVVDDAETPVPGNGEVLVKVEVIAFGPIESKIQKFGTHPSRIPTCLEHHLRGLLNQLALIYGGSSSCGGLAIRYAATAGYTVITTSSPKNSDKIVEEIRSHGPYESIFDTIGLPPVTNLLVEYLSSVDGGSYNTLIPPIGGENPIPENVHRKFAPYSWAFDEEPHKQIARWFYEEYVPKGLESGLIVPTRPQSVEGGLSKVQHALDLMDQHAMSGHKLVLNPWVE